MNSSGTAASVVAEKTEAVMLVPVASAFLAGVVRVGSVAVVPVFSLLLLLTPGPILLSFLQTCV